MKITKNQFEKVIREEVVKTLMEMCDLNKDTKKTHKKSLKEFVEKDDDIELINSTEDGSKQYVISLWNGNGYGLGAWRVFADEVKSALDLVVAHLEGEGKTEYFCDGDVETEEERMRNEGKDDEEIQNEIDEWAMYVDATMEGANKPHYVRVENLKIREI